MPSVEQPVLYMKVTDALRERTPEKIAALSETYNIADFPHLLSLAVELSPMNTVQWTMNLYESKGRDFSESDPNTGDTALHKAVSLGRTDIVRELMMHPMLDDTIRNKNGLTAPELASSPEMEYAVSSSENKFAQMMAVRLKAAFKERDVAALSKIYANPRVAEILNINGIDPDTGRNVLHDAAAANDIRVVQFILAHGGDPLIRDRMNQKLPQDMTSNEEIRRALINAAKSKAILDQTHGKPGPNNTKAPPSMQGYLKKWTNITSGYKLRWFELKNGELCYYKKPEDSKIGDKLMRGSISIRRAAVRLDSSEKNKFEIRTPSTRFHLKASHPAETNKWVWALQNAITWSRDEDKQKSSKEVGASQQVQQAQQPQQPQQAQQVQPQKQQLLPAALMENQSSNLRAASISSGGSGNAGAPVSSPKAEQFASPDGTNAGNQPPSALSSSRFSTSSPDRRNRSLSGLSDGDGWLVNDLNRGDDDDSDEDYADEQALKEPQIHAESLISRLSAVKDLMTMLVFQVQDETMRDAITTAQGSIDVLCSDIVMFERQANARTHRMKVDLERSDKGQRSWASNYRDLEVQYHQLETKLHGLMSKAGGSGADEDDDDEFFDTVDFRPSSEASGVNKDSGSGESNTKKVKDTVSGAAVGMAAAVGLHSRPRNARKTQDGSSLGSDASQQDHGPIPGTPTFSANTNSESTSGANGQEPRNENAVKDSSGPQGKQSDAASGAAAATGVAGVGAAAAGTQESAQHNDGDNSHEQNAEHGEQDTAQSSSPKEQEQVTEATDITPEQKEVLKRLEEEKSFAGYEDPPRQKLKIDADNRPKLSLWGILKNLVGKDMTKMSLPVTFNECTSLLQRSAEDMEYVDLLGHAAEAIHDGGLRMAYVAAFAGSSYSSTINRIAKPFNPLLGETYEYARPDMGYRLFAEQVSHHPPIGALMAESDKWDFYGESNVESKFYGRSFDINPLGLWYINLRPNKGADVESELYSFRKLTSSVVGIMLGNPVVDNYGDMEIKNHTTGITAVISYKARGWRANSAYKLQGKIMDKSGKVLWTMEGQWNDKMIAKKAGSDESVLLWQIHPRHKVPFNLTDFAVTLNALPERLKPWLPPTDTRLRPDQRAMEEGRYDDASDEKSRVENKQREKRREREMSGEKHKPQWFTLEKHPVTGLDYYKPINNYWAQRAEKRLGDKGDIF